MLSTNSVRIYTLPCSVVCHNFYTTNQEDIDNKKVITEEAVRRKNVDSHDPLFNVKLYQYVSVQLHSAHSAHGEVAFAGLVATVDPVIKEQLIEFLPQDLLPLLLPKT